MLRDRLSSVRVPAWPLTVLAAALAGALLVAQAPDPQGDTAPGGPDAAAYGQASGYPVGTRDTLGQQEYEVGGFSHFDALFPSREIAAAASPWPFQRAAPRPIRYRQGTDIFSLDDYMAHVPVTGLLIAKDDQILAERYQYGRTDHDRFTSQSMAKTVVAVLVGLAIADGKIASVHDRADAYVPDLKGSEYGATPIRDLLHMSSGMSCTGGGGLPALLTAPDALTPASVARGCTRTSPTGRVFQYSNIDSQVLAFVARAALGRPLADVFGDRIWRPMGAEAAATWTTAATGEPPGFCCINATLRDYARLGRLFANDGTRDGTSLIPRQWLVDLSSMNDQDPQLQPGKPAPFFGYGYQAWILPDERRMFVLLGGNGQRIFVDPQAKLVMAQTAVETTEIDLDRDAETIGLWLSLIAQFGRA